MSYKILLETGDALLKEDGDSLIKEWFYVIPHSIQAVFDVAYFDDAPFDVFEGIYQSSALAILGLTATGSKVLSIIRTKTGYLGLLTTGVAEFITQTVKTAIAYLGLKATGTKTLSIIKSANALLGLLGIGTLGAFKYFMSGLAFLGLRTTAINRLSIIRTNTALLGLLGIGTKVLKIIKTNTALLGLKGWAILGGGLAEITFTVYLYSRSLVAKLRNRSLIVNLFKRTLTAIIRRED